MNEKYNPEVWGTLSDWAMVLITLITAIFLILNFYQQRQSNKIAFSQHRRAIMPKLSVEQITVFEITLNEHLRFTVEDNDIFNIETQLLDDKFRDTWSGETRNYIKKDGFSLNVLKLKHYENPKNLHVAIFRFEDSEGNRYTQRLNQNGEFFEFQSPKFNG